MEKLLFVGRVAIAVLRRPHLISTALRQVAALAPAKWWASGSRLPVPRADYMEFRLATLSGDPDAMPTVEETITYLEWSRSMRSLPERS